MMQLFSMPGTEPNLRGRFMRSSQIKALQEMEDSNMGSYPEAANVGAVSLMANLNTVLDSEQSNVASVLDTNPPHNLSSILN